MENQIAQDTELFLLSVLLGVFFGLFYEVFRLIRLAIPHSTFLVACEDFFFFLPVTAVFLLFTYAVSWGVIRWFSLFGVSIGFFLYRETLGKLIHSFSASLIQLIRRLFSLLFRRTLLPIWFVFKNITIFLFTKCRKQVIIRKRIVESKKLKKQMMILLKSAKRGFEK